MHVDELTPNISHRAEDLYEHDDAKYPENYLTCFQFIIFLQNIIRVTSLGHVQKRDVENPNGQQLGHEQGDGAKKIKGKRPEVVPKNCSTCFNFFKFILKIMRVLLGIGSIQIERIRDEKEKHTWAVQIMEILLKYASSYEYEFAWKSRDGDGGTDLRGESIMVDDDHSELLQAANNSKKASQNNKGEQNDGNGKQERGYFAMETRETPLLVAAKNGITEMVARILELFPLAIHDTNNKKENIVLLAVENRQPHVYRLLLNDKLFRQTIFQKTDKDGNNALHLAAMKMGDHQPLRSPGPAFQMQWEMKWYEFVKNTMPLHFFERYNMKGETPSDLFIANHKDQVEIASKWLKDTSQSCSVVATLVATVAFASSTTIPGGLKQEGGIPALGKELAFCLFGIASLIVLCFSVSSIMMFLAFFSSSYHETEFNMVLPRKLVVGLTSLFVSLASMLVSFCAAHFLIMRDQLKYAAFPLYVVIFFLVTFYAVAQFPWYFDVALTTFSSVPQRSSRRQLS